MVVEREGGPMLHSEPVIDAHVRAEEIQAQLDRLESVIAYETEQNALGIIKEDCAINEKRQKAIGEFLDVLFGSVLKPITHPLQLEIIEKAVAHMLLDKPIDYPEPVEDAIDLALQEAIDDAGSPIQTGLLALARHRIESQRRQLASA